MDHENHIEVAVHTTAGRYPANGYESTPVHQKVRVMLEKAAKALKITNVDQWIARVDGKEIDTNTTYLDNGLHGKVIIDFGPRESGGG